MTSTGRQLIYILYEGQWRCFPLTLAIIYSQPARAKHQWTVNQRSRRSHVSSSGAEASPVDGNNRLFLFLSLFPFFFFSPWQNNLRPSAGLPLCSLALDFRSEEEKMDGRNEWEVREGCHGNTAFIIPSKFTPQLLGRRPRCLCVWLIDASPLSPRLLFLCRARVCHLPARCWNPSSKL